MSSASAAGIIKQLDLAPIGAQGDAVFEGQHLLTLLGFLEQLSNRVGNELETRLVLIVPFEKREYYQPAIPIFGLSVTDKFPAATTDIFEAR